MEILSGESRMMMWQAGIAGIAGLTQKSVKVGSFTESLVPPHHTPTEYDPNTLQDSQGRKTIPHFNHLNGVKIYIYGIVFMY
jgi:hypothetical protein